MSIFENKISVHHIKKLVDEYLKKLKINFK